MMVKDLEAGVLLACLLAGAFGCASAVSRPEDVARTWERAMVALPSDPSPSPKFFSSPGKAAAPAPLPTVLYMHVCSAIGGDEMQWARTLTRAGYAVVMPDSFARSYRRTDCDPANTRGGLFPEAFAMRDEEIRYAAAQLRTLPWVDARNLFLMGTSEGGAAAALWGGGGFNGQIIVAWWCRHGGDRLLDGIRAPFAIPMLAINFERDPWFSPYYASSACATRLRGYRDGSELILRKTGHNAGGEPEAERAVLDFLRRHTRP